MRLRDWNHSVQGHDACHAQHRSKNGTTAPG